MQHFNGALKIAIIHSEIWPNALPPASRRRAIKDDPGAHFRELFGSDLSDAGGASRNDNRLPCPSCDLVDTGLSGLALCLFGGDIPEGGMEPLTIVVSFDVDEQVVPGGIPG